MQAALKQLVCPDRRAYVAHDISVLNYSGHERKEDLVPVGNDHTWGYELFQSLVIQGGSPLGAAFTELRHSRGLLSSQSADILPFTDHLEQTERAIDAIEKLLPGCQLVHLCDREFDDLQLLRALRTGRDTGSRAGLERSFPSSPRDEDRQRHEQDVERRARRLTP